MYDALIIVNGDIPKLIFWQHFEYRTLICTDGAALSLKETTLIPNYIVGDMDSIADSTPIATVESLQLQFPQSKIVLNVDQETTDFEKALQLIKQIPFDKAKKSLPKVLCVGYFGKSADHSIYNLCLLHRFSDSIDLTLFHHDGHHAQWVKVLPSDLHLKVEKNAIVSFFPWPKAKLNTQGLCWELQNQSLCLETMNSVRNKTRDEDLIISCEGHCLCFITATQPPIVIDPAQA